MCCLKPLGCGGHLLWQQQETNKKRVDKVFITEKTLDADLIDSQDFVTWIKWEDI